MGKMITPVGGRDGISPVIIYSGPIKLLPRWRILTMAVVRTVRRRSKRMLSFTVTTKLGLLNMSLQVSHVPGIGERRNAEAEAGVKRPGYNVMMLDNIGSSDSRARR